MLLELGNLGEDVLVDNIRMGPSADSWVAPAGGDYIVKRSVKKQPLR